MLIACPVIVDLKRNELKNSWRASAAVATMRISSAES
jgi:hypothetical protein